MVDLVGQSLRNPAVRVGTKLGRPCGWAKRALKWTEAERSPTGRETLAFVGPDPQESVSGLEGCGDNSQSVGYR